ncbi:MAG: NYN domain-containing protein [Phycisphaerae bacterium]|nr:NYN domain-containing protein [Phycisphaerae bacterium]
MKKAAILLDGGFVLKRLFVKLGRRHPSADEVYDFALACIDSGEEELFRIYYYDCPPFGEKVKNPLAEEKTNFAATEAYKRNTRLQQQLVLKDHVAYRAGELLLQGWKLNWKTAKGLVRAPKQLGSEDFEPDFQQKRVDIKIGLDVAWMASKGIVDRLILVTGDSDFIPAMKFARREGTQVILVPMGYRIRSELREHVDLVRNVPFPPPLLAKTC